MTFHQLLSHHIICFLNIGLKRYELTSMCYQWKDGNKIRDGPEPHGHIRLGRMRNIKFCSSFSHGKYIGCSHQGFGSREAAEVTSAGRGEGLPHARHSWLQPALQQTHRTQLRPSAMLVAPPGKHI